MSSLSRVGDRLHRLLARVVELERRELAPLLWALACYTLLLTGYYVARPVRETFGLKSGIDRLPLMMLATVLVIVTVNPLYSGLVARLPRSRFIPLIFRGVSACFVLFFVALRLLDGEAVIWTGRVFYVFLSVVNLFLVSVFFSLLSDLFDKGKAARLFGAVAAGGSLGGILGGSITSHLVEALGPGQLLLISCVFFEGALWAARGVMRCCEPRAALEGAAAPTAAVREDVALGGSRWAGFRAVARSPYLLGICGYVFCYGISGTFAYFFQAQVVNTAADGDWAAATKIFADLDRFTSLAALFFQLVVAGRLLKRIGAGATLMILPLYSVLGFGLLASGWIPAGSMLLCFGVFQVFRRALGYGIQKPARELLFTVVPAEDKYKAKNLVDLAGARTGDVMGAATDTALRAAGFGLLGLAATAMPVSLVWLATAVALGVGFRRRAAEQDLSVTELPRG